jgi:Sad1 / UNC-like C-terminal
MRGTTGQLTVQLVQPAVISAISIDHINPASALDASSALKDFELYGLPAVDAKVRLLLLLLILLLVSLSLLFVQLALQVLR